MIYDYGTHKMNRTAFRSNDRNMNRQFSELSPLRHQVTVALQVLKEHVVEVHSHSKDTFPRRVAILGDSNRITDRG